MRGSLTTRLGRSSLVVAALLVSATFAYTAVRNVDLGLVGQSLRTSQYWWLLPAFPALALAVFLRAVRWRCLFVAETRPPLWPVTEALLLGQFFNNILPARAGEIVRVVALNLRSGTSRAETLATVVVERVFDVLVLLMLLFLALPWFPDVSWLRPAALLAVGLAGVLVVAVVTLALYGERPLRFVLRPLSRISFFPVDRVERAALDLTQGLAGLRRARLGVLCFLLTVVSWLILALSFWLLMLGFDLEVSLEAGLLVAITTGLSLIIPSGPAALGIFEAATLVALGAYGIPESQALSYALVLHALNFLPYMVTGLIILNIHAVALRPRSLGI